MAQVTITGVLAHEFPDAWPLVAQYFDSFAERSRGEVTIAELVKSIGSGQRQCWIAIVGDEVKACALTQVVGESFKTVLLDFCAGKDRNEWRDAMVDEIRRWGAHIGARRLRIICRPGWTKELKRLGLRETHRVLEEDLDGQE